MTPDVNVLVAAYRSDHPHHAKASRWLLETREACARGSTPLRLLPMALVGFLRVVTNRRVYLTPDPIEDAVAFVESLLASPGVEIACPQSEWPLLREKLLGHGLAGNLVTDAWIASSVQSLGEHLVTFDSDFRKLLPARDLSLLTARG